MRGRSWSLFLALVILVSAGCGTIVWSQQNGEARKRIEVSKRKGLQRTLRKEKSRIHKLRRLTADKHAYCLEKVTALDNVLASAFKNMNFNGSAAWVVNGERIWSKSVGFKSLERYDPLSNQDAYQLASVSKQFTAIAILILKERGQLQLDDLVSQYLPDFVYTGITIRHLLQHTSGLPNYMQILEVHWKLSDLPDNNEMLGLLYRKKLPIHFKPGTRFEYSNTGYAVLASIIEKVSGKRYADFMQEEIFSKAGMQDAFVFHGSDTLDRVTGYHQVGKKLKPVKRDVSDGIIGDKNIFASLNDMIAWYKALRDNTLISEETTQEAFTQGRLKNGMRIPYGMGFRIKQTAGTKIVYHQGLWNGFRTSFVMYPDRAEAYILLNHTNHPAKHIITSRIEKVISKQSERLAELPG